ncbi:MAG: Calx-beta domain-containing protein [Actinomycetota bacterium]
MKKILSNLFILAVTIFMVTSCDENYPVMYDESNIIVGMSSSAVSVREDGDGAFTLYLGGVSGTASTDVALSVSVDGLANPAIEGTDFTLSTKSVSLPVGTAAVTVNPINNDIYQGNKQFRVSISSNTKNYSLAVQKSIVVTIVDDEHPLKPWIGTYDVEAVSYYAPGAYDEAWVVTTTGGDTPSTLLATGIAFGNAPVVIEFNTDDMTVEIESGQSLGDIDEPDGPYAGSIYFATDEIIDDAGDYTETSFLTAAEGIKMTGTFTNDGVITIKRVAIILDDYVYCWDVFDTTWTLR